MGADTFDHFESNAPIAHRRLRRRFSRYRLLRLDACRPVLQKAWQRMRAVLALFAALLLAGCASEDEDYDRQQGSPSVRLAKPAGEPGMAVKQAF
jgi:hypothetical protein